MANSRGVSECARVSPKCVLDPSFRPRGARARASECSHVPRKVSAFPVAAQRVVKRSGVAAAGGDDGVDALEEAAEIGRASCRERVFVGV